MGTSVLADVDETRWRWRRAQNLLLAETDAARDRLREVRERTWHELYRRRACLQAANDVLRTPALCPVDWSGDNRADVPRPAGVN